ncbi:MAG: hypothetical protein EOM52_11020 [Clostridia bacterium]|nr:hypothetical protein [Clostridia bacterium]
MKKTITSLLLFAVLALSLGGCAAEKPYEAGSWSGSAYTSSFLGLTYTLPDGWTSAADPELADMEAQAEAALQQAKNSDKADSNQNYHYALSAKSGDGSLGVIVMAQRQDYAVKDYVKALQSGAAAEGSNYTLGEIGTKTLGNYEYTVIPVIVQGQDNIQHQYVRVDGSYLTNIMAFAPDDAGFATIEASFSAVNS